MMATSDLLVTMVTYFTAVHGELWDIVTKCEHALVDSVKLINQSINQISIAPIPRRSQAQ